MGALDTTKYFGDRPKHLVVGPDLLYNQIALYQMVAFDSTFKTAADSLSQFSRMVDSLVKVAPNYPEVPNLLFNKALFLSVSGDKKAAGELIKKVRREFSDFQYKDRLDSLECKNDMMSCSEKEKGSGSRD
jgi:murein endopeptidase